MTDIEKLSDTALDVEINKFAGEWFAVGSRATPGPLWQFGGELLYHLFKGGYEVRLRAQPAAGDDVSRNAVARAICNAYGFSVKCSLPKCNKCKDWHIARMWTSTDAAIAAMRREERAGDA